MLDIDTRTRGNSAFLMLREAVNGLLCYENSQWEVHSGSKSIPDGQAGVRLIQAKQDLFAAMKSEDALYAWFEEKRHEEFGPPAPLAFFEWTWKSEADVRDTVRAVLMRIDRYFVQNLAELLEIKQAQGQKAEEVLTAMRGALEIENKALHDGRRSMHQTRDFLVDLIWLLASAYQAGKHDKGRLRKGVVTDILRKMAAGRGLTIDVAKKIWTEAKPALDGQVVRGSDGVALRMRTKGWFIEFERIDG